MPILAGTARLVVFDVTGTEYARPGTAGNRPRRSPRGVAPSRVMSAGRTEKAHRQAPIVLYGLSWTSGSGVARGADPAGHQDRHPPDPHPFDAAHAYRRAGGDHFGRGPIINPRDSWESTVKALTAVTTPPLPRTIVRRWTRLSRQPCEQAERPHRAPKSTVDIPVVKCGERPDPC
jgi:hypothetical protein